MSRWRREFDQEIVDTSWEATRACRRIRIDRTGVPLVRSEGLRSG